MKFNKMRLAAAIGAIIIAFSGTGMIPAYATSVGDVIAYARSIGMPESEIQGYIAKYGGRDYTSEQCDQAIAALAGMKNKYKKNSQGDSAETKADQDQNSQQNNENKSEETEAPSEKEQVKNFFKKPSEEKIKEINGMSNNEIKEFWNSLSEDEKKKVQEILGTDDIKDIDTLKAAAKKAVEELELDEETTTKAIETTKKTTENTEESSEIETETETFDIKVTDDNQSYTGVIVAAVVVIIAVIAIFIGISRKSGRKKK